MGLCVISKPGQRGLLGTSSATAPQKIKSILSTASHYSVTYTKRRLLALPTQEKCRRKSRCLSDSDSAWNRTSCNPSRYVRCSIIDDSSLRDSVCDLPSTQECVISFTRETNSSISKPPRAEKLHKRSRGFKMCWSYHITAVTESIWYTCTKIHSLTCSCSCTKWKYYVITWRVSSDQKFDTVSN